MKKELSPEEERAKREEKRRKHRERVKARRAAKYDAHFKEGSNVAAEPVGLTKGNHDIRHGLYAKVLQPDEMERLHALVAEYAAEHGITLKSDMDMLHLAVSFLIKACRPEPDTDPADKNVRSYQAYYARQYGDWMDRLAMSRKVRKEDDKRGDLLNMVSNLFTGGAPAPVIDATPKRDKLTE